MGCVRRWIQVAVLVAALAAGGAGSAGAVSEMQFLTPGPYRISSAGRLTFQAGAFAIACGVTMTGELRAGPLFEGIPLMDVLYFGTECEGGGIAADNLPWSVDLFEFLPGEAATPREAIDGLSVDLSATTGNGRISIRGNILGLTCRYFGRPDGLIDLQDLGGVIAPGAWTYGILGLRFVSEEPMERALENPWFCPATARVTGAFTWRQIVVAY